MPARSIALVVLVTAVWGANFVVIHAGLDHFPPLLFNALRFTVMAVPAIFLVGRPRRERPGPPVPADPRRRGGLGRRERDHAHGAAARPARHARVGEPRGAAAAAWALAAVRG